MGLKRLVADLSLDNAILKEADEGKLLSPLKRRKLVLQVCTNLAVSERRACRVLRQVRTTQRYTPHLRSEEETLTPEIVKLRALYGRYGYRRITALLRQEGWKVNSQDEWREYGEKKASRCQRSNLNGAGSLLMMAHVCHLRPEHKDHVWSYDFMMARTADERGQDTHYY